MSRIYPTIINYPHHLYIRDLMVRNGDAEKPIWISEMNWNAAPADLPETYGRVTDAQQAQYLVQAYQRAQREWPWIGVTSTWFFKRPSDTEQGQAWYYFRVMEPDFRPLPAFEALAAYASQPQQVAARSPVWFWWLRVRPVLALAFGSLLFYWILVWSAPTQTLKGRNAVSSIPSE